MRPRVCSERRFEHVVTRASFGHQNRCMCRIIHFYLPSIVFGLSSVYVLHRPTCLPEDCTHAEDAGTV